MQQVLSKSYNPRTKILVINGIRELLPREYYWCKALPKEHDKEPMCAIMEHDREIARLTRHDAELGLEGMYEAYHLPNGKKLSPGAAEYQDPNHTPDIIEVDDVAQFMKDMGWGEATKEAEDEDWDRDEGDMVVMTPWEEEEEATRKEDMDIIMRLRKEQGLPEHPLGSLPAPDLVTITPFQNPGGAGKLSNPSSSSQPTSMLTPRRNAGNTENTSRPSGPSMLALRPNPGDTENMGRPSTSSQSAAMPAPPRSTGNTENTKPSSSSQVTPTSESRPKPENKKKKGGKK